jgi:putative ABC transport system permease protein
VTGWSVMLRGIRYRSGRSLVVLLLAAFATAAAVLTPAYGRAAAQSVLTDGLRAAPPTAAAVTVSAESSAAGAQSGSFDPAQQSSAEAKTLVDNAFKKAPHLAALLEKPISSVETEAAADTFVARLAWRMSACSQLKINGSCAVDAEQVMVSERSAAEAGIKAGDHLNLHAGKGGARRLQVVGLYTPKDPSAVYWGNSAYFAHSPIAPEGLPRLDAIFTGAEDDVRLPGATAISVKLTYPLKPQALRLDDVPALRGELGALGLSLNAAELQLETALLSIVDDAAKDQAVLAKTVPLIAVPLLVLAWVVMLLIVASLTEERSPELALARLRGFPNGRVSRFGLGETLLLIALGAPLGAVAGLGLVELTSRAILAPGTPVELRWPVFAAAGIGVAAAFAAAWLATRRTFAQGVLTLLRRVPQRARKRAGVIEAIAVTLALAALVALLQDRGSSLALLAPAALALVAGIVAGRLLTAWARVRLAMARRRGSVAGILAAAQLARRPGTARIVVVLTTALALLSFAAASWDVALRERDRHARETLGAQTVYQVIPASPEALVAAVAAADPTAHSMAVIRGEQEFDQRKVELLGVQSTLLGDVAIWPGKDKAAVTALGKKLRGDAAKPATVGGDISVRAITAGIGEVPLRLGAVIARPGQPPAVSWLGDVKAGQKDYAAALPTCPAAAGCRLVGLALGRAGGLTGAIRATLTVGEIRSGATSLPLRAGDAGAWRNAADRNPTAKVQVAPGDKLTLAVESTGPGDVVISYLDTPARLPVVVAGNAGVAASAGNAGEFDFPGLAGSPQAFTQVEKDPRVPRAGDNALLFDYDLAVRAGSVTTGLSEVATLRYEVWAASDAPAGLDRKLADNGLRVIKTQTLQGELEQLGRRAPALGFRLYLLAGIAAAALGLGVLLLSLRLGARERRAELEALRATGVRAQAIRRAARRERFALLATPLILGLLTGVGSALLMLPGVPMVTANVTARPENLWQALIPQLQIAALPLSIAGAVVVLLTGLITAGRVGAR